jgi:hypothetical protein
VCEAEQDEFLELFSRKRRPHGKAAEWLRQWLSEAKMKQRNVKEMPGYEEMFQKLVEAMPIEKRLAGLGPEEVMRTYAPEQRLAGLDPEQRLAGLDPEQRLAGLDPEQRLAGLDAVHAVLALPAEVLRGLSESYVRSLPAEAQKEIKKRLRHRSVPGGPKKAKAAKAGQGHREGTP